MIRCFNFQEQRLSKIDSKLENAICVSYYETLLCENDEEVMKNKRELMHEKLKWYYDEYEIYYRDLIHGMGKK